MRPREGNGIGKAAWIALGVLTALNLGAAAVNLSTRADAKVAGMDAWDLKRDRDFQKAVSEIVEKCSIDGRTLKISC